MKRFSIITLLVLLVLCVALYLRPVPAVQATVIQPQVDAGQAANMPWPASGEAAIGIEGTGPLTTYGSQNSLPIASIAKIVTALAVIQKKPLATGQQGPDITIGPADVALYQKYVNEQGSVVPVNEGEEISEYQALQALLLPSGNNIADTLVTWAFGSTDNYLAYANKYVASLNLSHTHLDDASGFSPKSVSSAHDLVILGEKLMANPSLAAIVGQPTATLPVAGKVENVNYLLGADGVVGIKTGNTDQAGGCFLFAAKRSVSGQNITMLGAVLAAPDLVSAIGDSDNLIQSSDQIFQSVTIAKKGRVVGIYHAKWGATSKAIAAQDITVVNIRGVKTTSLVKLESQKAPVSQGQKVGSITTLVGQKNTTAPVVMQQSIPAPSIFWRIFHI